MEKKYVSDLTPKERRQLELKKLKSMTVTGKLQYLWMYYKFVLVIVVLGIMGISVGVQIFQGLREETLLSVAIVDANYDNEEQIEKLKADLTKALGKGGKYETVDLDASLQSGEAYTSSIKRLTVLASGTLDLLICDEETYEFYQGEEAYLDWSQILGEKAAAYGTMIEGNRLMLSGNPRWDRYGLTSYEPVFAVVMASSQNVEGSAKFAEFFAEAW